MIIANINSTLALDRVNRANIIDGVQALALDINAHAINGADVVTLVA